MTQVTASIPDELAEALDATAKQSNLSVDDIVRQALEFHLEELDDVSVALERLCDPSDPELDWNEVRSEILASD